MCYSSLESREQHDLFGILVKHWVCVLETGSGNSGKQIQRDEFLLNVSMSHISLILN